MTSFFDRLDKFMEYKGLNDNKITLEAGISNGLIGKARKRGALSQDNISKILHTYPELNANWLLSDRGEMLLKNESDDQTLKEPHTLYGLDNDELKLKLLESLLFPDTKGINEKIDTISAFLSKMYFKISDLEKKVDEIKKVND